MSRTSEKPTILESRAPLNPILRGIHAIVFVGIWMTMGWLFHLEADSYLLIGVPLAAAFQVFVCKKSLVSLWVRDAPRFGLDTLGIVLALAFAVLPAIELIRCFISPGRSSHAPEILWLVCCIGGAFCAAFSLRRFTRETWKSLLFCMATAGVIGCGIMAGAALLRGHSIIPTHEQAVAGLRSLALYFPICFILEEVVFRGAIDSHIHHPGDKRPWLSAIFVSVLWGLWHVPILGGAGILQLAALIIVMTCIHLPPGVFLSFGWRRSGNLAVPALAHAAIDAVRNMLLT